ncbi:MAG: extracellular solute-binding protein [Actinobacteria bacterium]|nr:extracellular solute-binding protein [Actinomycetota bacterium]
MPVTSRNHLRSARRRSSFRPAAAGLAGALAAALIAGCGGSGTPASGGGPSGSASPSASVLAGGSCKSSSATKITFWAWVPGIARAVDEFNKTHSSICVTLEDVGAGNPEYVKLSNALKAGSGAPDVAEVEFDELPSFEVQHYVVNLAKYGANAYRKDFVPWAWHEVSQGGGVYAMPSDSGPMGFYYNAKLLAKYHLKPPATWSKFASEAAALHRANSSAYLTNFAGTDLQWVMSLMAQYNAFPFSYTGGSHVTINWTGPRQLAFAAYWQNMLSKHELNTVTDITAQAFADMDKGIDASWLSSAWGPSYFAPDAKSSVGNWRAAPLPQWTAGANVAANWGGSTYPVFTQSSHPQQAAQFSEWLCANQASWNIVKTPPSSLFPTFVPLLKNPSFKNLKYPPSGSSSPNVAFTAAAPRVTTVQWPPFMTYALTQAGTTFAGVMNGKETLQQAFRTFQGQLVNYAKQQGFSVST